MKLRTDILQQYVHYMDESKGFKTIHTKLIDTRYVSYSGEDRPFQIGDKVTLIDPNNESEMNPLFAHVRGYYSDNIFSSDENHALYTGTYRKALSTDRASTISKYPYTRDLSEYNNWLFFSQMKRKESDLKQAATISMDMREMYGIDTSSIGLSLFQNMNIHSTSRQKNLEFIPRHLHYDDFVEKWNGHIKIDLTSRMDPLSYRPGNKYGGIIIGTSFTPGSRYSPLDGVEWFNNHDNWNSDYTKTVNDLLQYPQHINMYATLNRELVGERNKLEMWDPVSDTVRIEKILGNVSFLSEFGYICTMSKYDLIIGDLEMRKKYCLI